MAARPGAQDAETILSVVVGYSFDEARQHFPGIRPRTHADHRVSRSIPGILLLIHASCDFDVVALRDLAAFNDFGINAAIAVAEVACERLRNFEVANAGVGIDIGRRAARDALDDFQPRAAADNPPRKFAMKFSDFGQRVLFLLMGF